VIRALGLDVGGSKLAACLLDVERGTVLESARVATNPTRGGRAVLDACVALVDAISAAGECAGDEPLGIGICELVDRSGRITSAASVDWREVDVRGAFPTHSAVVVESDVRAAALGEARLGAGRGRGDFVYLNVGTGISFALVLDGSPYAGARGNALILGAPPVEGLSSGAALAELGGAGRAEEVFASSGASTIVEKAGDHLGRAMAWLVNALDPEMIVIGGGLGLRADYRAAATTAMRQHIEAETSRDIEVVPAALGEDSGAIGAALLVAERVARMQDTGTGSA
jgi:glucokinase